MDENVRGWGWEKIDGAEGELHPPPLEIHRPKCEIVGGSIASIEGEHSERDTHAAEKRRDDWKIRR